MKLINLQAIYLKEVKKSNFQELALKDLALNAQNTQNMQLKELKSSN